VSACGCSHRDHPSANDSSAVVQPRWCSATTAQSAWRCMSAHSNSHAMRRMRASAQGLMLGCNAECAAVMVRALRHVICIARVWARCVDCCPTRGGALCSRLRVGRGWEQSVPDKLLRDRQRGGVRDCGHGSRGGLLRQSDGSVPPKRLLLLPALWRVLLQRRRGRRRRPRHAAAVLRCGQSRTAGPGTAGYYLVLTRYYRAPTGATQGAQLLCSRAARLARPA
jgi:hypothetical protein